MDWKIAGRANYQNSALNGTNRVYDILLTSARSAVGRRALAVFCLRRGGERLAAAASDWTASFPSRG
jgi:hypothetical protein